MAGSPPPNRPPGRVLWGGAGYGIPTDRPWAVTFTNPYAGAPLGVPLHPTQLYECASDLVLFAALWTLGRRPAAPGRLFLVFLLGSALSRLALEPVKGDVIPITGTVTFGEALGLVVVLGVAAQRARRKWCEVGP